jgi:hypothetical protein
VKVGDLVKNKRYPYAGIGVVIRVGTPTRWQHGGYAIAIFPSLGEQVIYADEVEAISALK